MNTRETVGDRSERRSTSDRGSFVVFEGVEGAGKSTQVRLLSRFLEERGVRHVVKREPGGTELGETLRQLLLHEESLSAPAELLLLLAARAQLIERVVRPELESGAMVLVDRYELSTLAYQGYGRGIPLEEIRRLNCFATGGLRPDVTFLLDVSPELGAERRRLTGRGADRIEGAGDAFHRRVAEAYHLLAKEEPGVIPLDGTGAPEEVHSRIVCRLRESCPETLGAGTG